MPNKLHSDVKRRADGLEHAGFALQTISNLLGCDGCDHALTTDEFNGLLHAMHALGEFVLETGFALGEAADK